MQSKEINLTEVREFAVKLALGGGNILRDSFEKREVTISGWKGSIDFTTEADIAVDKFLQGEISIRYPETQILSEETASEDYLKFRDAEYVWVNDPMDGTANFFHGFPRFAVSIALLRRGIPQVGVVYLPMAHELFWAQEDRQEAILNSKPIRVSSIDNLKKASFLCDWCPDEEKRKLMMSYLKRIIGEVWQIKSQGSAVADLCSLAAGQSEAYLNPGLKPWDVAAASLIVRKAGGEVTTPDGGSFDLFNTDIFATNGILHQGILDLINK